MSEKILVTQSSMPSMDEYVEEIKDIWANYWLTNMGPKHEELRNQLKTYLDVAEVELFTNGHMAIELALQAMDLTGEVITTPFTFASTTNAIIRNGLEPVFCDIDPITFTMDVNKIEALITEKTLAIMPVHVYGNVCNVEEIEKIAEKHNLKVIYDAAHTFGEKYKGRGIASYGDASCFSFHATKVFNSVEGGATCFNDQEFGRRLYNLKNFGIAGEDIEEIGPNAKMNEFCAAMGLCNLRHVDEEIAKRKQVVERYRNRLADIPGIQLNCIQEDLESNYAYFPVVFDPEVYGMNRDEVLELLKENNIMARKYFYPLTSEFSCFKGKYDANETPVALRISQNVLTLPLYAELSLENVDRICDVIRNK
ncbi:dTDP-4-amino-4,6-dideoxygalactose transaminase [Granulicatella balaenopterae]|uniref:dTDP-4-amino-4,6-dideoxygalactose transaminase n=1 Tax=Granulicatella balaenopterae TaxID=137733 RepID=A0A1H9K9Y7_9LACT|nr:DegT/DnrJ/EryC1/StrS family aminotransferase [Granulicatella balaenopterae]SEQ95878.1 dTDP-4-amino-4,6-dideoxygalactose transaminase [Granulicatella balaenopterae]